MEKKSHKHSRNHSPHEYEEHKRKKSHKRQHSEPQSNEEEDSNRRKHHKHRHKKDKERRPHGSGNNRYRSDSDNGHSEHGSDTDQHRARHESSGKNSSSAEREGSRSRHHHRHDRPHDRGSAEFDPTIRIKQEKDEHNYEEQQRERQQHDQRRRDARRGRDRAGGDHGLNTEAPARVKPEPGGPDGAAGNDGGKENNDGAAAAERQQPNFELSGKLTEDTNTFRGVVIKYNEPPEAMRPKRRWRLYPFKGQESLPVLHIHRQSAFLLGRDRRIADIPVDHPSCSKQQAVLQFRAMPYTRPDGTPGRRVRPYIIDLESANGTYLNGDKVDARRYYELKEKDVIKFGYSSREYVVLHDSVDVSEVAAGEDMEEA